MKNRTSGITLDVGKPLIVYPGLQRYFAANGANTGIARDAATLYGCLDYWQDKGEAEDGFIYKYVIQIEKETNLSASQQLRCRKFLKKISWIEEKTKKINGRNVVAFKTKYNLTTKAEHSINAALK